MRSFLSTLMLSIVFLCLMSSCSEIVQKTAEHVAKENEVLNAFQKVNESSRKDSFDRTDKEYDAILIDEQRYAAIMPAAYRLMKITDTTLILIASIKAGLIAEAGGQDSFDRGMLDDNLPVTDNYMIKEGNSTRLQKGLLKYYATLHEIAPSDTNPIIEQQRKDIKKGDCTSTYFQRIPVVASITILNSFRNNIKVDEEMTMYRPKIS